MVHAETTRACRLARRAESLFRFERADAPSGTPLAGRARTRSRARARSLRAERMWLTPSPRPRRPNANQHPPCRGNSRQYRAGRYVLAPHKPPQSAGTPPGPWRGPSAAVPSSGCQSCPAPPTGRRS
eukprot:scaffold330265_cov62-Tisochrysis_lutea.AAC.2